MGAFMVGLMFGEIAVLFNDLTARGAAFQRKYDNACAAMQHRKLEADLQDRIIIYQKATREAEEHAEDLENFRRMIGPRQLSYVNRFVLGSLLLKNSLTAPLLRDRGSDCARGCA